MSFNENLAFVFEIKDGPDPEGQKYWGRWGLLTHEQAGGVSKKPKYNSLLLLNRMAGERIKFNGADNNIFGFAARKNDTLRIILVNFDIKNKGLRRVFLTFKNLKNGIYSYREIFSQQPSRNSTETIINHLLRKEIILGANGIVVIELTAGKSGLTN